MGFKGQTSSNKRGKDDTAVRVTQSLAWLRTHASGLYKSLASSNEASLRALEDKVGPLPAPFRAFYELHDGQRSEDVEFVPCYYLAGCQEILATWPDLQTYDGYYRYKKGWIPFARFDCDYLCLNLEADAQSRGEVIAVFLRCPEIDVIASDFTAFLEKQREYLVSGVFSQADDGTDYTPMLELSWLANWELDLLLQRGDTDTALEMLSRLVKRAPRVKKQLREDPRFVSLQHTKRFMLLTQTTSWPS